MDTVPQTINCVNVLPRTSRHLHSHLLWTSLEPGHCHCAVCPMEPHMNISKPHTHTHTPIQLPFSGTTQVSQTVSGSGISWVTCKSALHSRKITTPVPTTQFFFTRRMPFLPPNQQRQSTGGTILASQVSIKVTGE